MGYQRNQARTSLGALPYPSAMQLRVGNRALMAVHRRGARDRRPPLRRFLPLVARGAPKGGR